MRLKWPILLVVILIAVSLTVVFLIRPALVPTTGLEGITWAPIEWTGAQFGDLTYERAALMLPVYLDGVGQPLAMRLDLGTPTTRFYEIPYQQLFPDRASPVAFNGRVGEYRVSGDVVEVRPGAGGSLVTGADPAMVGTIGLDFFSNRILLLDFPNERFAILDGGGPLPAGLERQSTFVITNQRDGRLFIPVQINERIYGDDFFYDSGSTVFSLVTDRALWQELTARTGDEDGNRVVQVPAWGEEVQLVGAPMIGTLQIAQISVNQPEIFYVDGDHPELDLDDPPFHVEGAVGNALFYEDYLIILDLNQSRLGLYGPGTEVIPGVGP